MNTTYSNALDCSAMIPQPFSIIPHILKRRYDGGILGVSYASYLLQQAVKNENNPFGNNKNKVPLNLSLNLNKLASNNRSNSQKNWLKIKRQ